MKKPQLILFFLLFTFLFGRPDYVQAQAPGNVGLGLQLGQPSGITLKVFTPGPVAIDFLAAWDLDEFFFLNVHGLWQTQVGNVDRLYFFYGPGAFIGFRDNDFRDRDRDDDLVLGISGSFGLSYYIEQFEIFLQATPRVQLVDKTDGDMGGGLGFRFYF